MKVLITGASGQVGRALLRTAPAQAELRALSRQELDISDVAAVRMAVEDFQPSVIINAAAYTAVDKAETVSQTADAVNGRAPGYLAEAARTSGNARLVHISTDYVFDGHAAQPYLPGDRTNPMSAYGRSKLQGERAVLETSAERTVVLRTAWVYAAHGKNFLLTMLRLMGERGAVRVVADQRGSPTAAASVARAIWRIVELPEVHGVLHWTDDGVASWYDFACAIAEDAMTAGLLTQRIEVTPIRTIDYPTPAPRPLNSVLDNRDSISQLELLPVPWRSSLRVTLAELARVGCN